jgi:putative inorganic carbon (HCO3(-)) transporter
MISRREKTRKFIEGTVYCLTVVFLFAIPISIAVSQTALFAALVLLIFVLIDRDEIRLLRSPIDVFFLFYVAAELLSTIFAVDKLQSLIYARRLLLIAAFYVVRTTARKEADLRNLLTAFGLGVLVMAAVGIYRHYSGLNPNRLQPFQDYMTTGGILMMALLMLVPIIVHVATPLRVRILSALASIPILLALLLTFTRSSWLGALAGLVVVGVLRAKVILVAAVVIVLLFVLVAPPGFIDRARSSFDLSHPSNQGRLLMWKTGVAIFLDNPLVGVGDIGIEKVYDKYAPPWQERQGHLHNNLLMWLVTLGILGTIALLAFFLKILQIEFLSLKATSSWLTNSLALGAIAVFFAFHVNGLFEWNFGDAEPMTVFYAILGLSMSAKEISERKSTS